MRLGLRNNSKRSGMGPCRTLAHWALFTDWRLNTREGQSTFADAYSDLELRPFRWLALNSEVRYDVDEASTFRIIGSSSRPTIPWSLTLGHRYVRDNALVEPPNPAIDDPGNNLFFSTIYYRFNEKLGDARELPV